MKPELTLEQVKELMKMNSLQIIQNSEAIKALTKSTAESRKEHDREMKELRGLFKQVIRRLSV